MTRKFLMALLAFAFFNSCLAASSDEMRNSVEVVSAEFGIFSANDSREVIFEPTAQVPLLQGQRYGWVVEVRTAKRSLSVREEYLLPYPEIKRTTTDAAQDTLTIPLERITQVSQRQLVPVDGKIYGEWAISPGEPTGHRHLQIVIEG